MMACGTEARSLLLSIRFSAYDVMSHREEQFVRVSVSKYYTLRLILGLSQVYSIYQ